MATIPYAGGNTQRPLDLYAAADCSVATGIAAKAGGGQSGATELTAAYNDVSTVASSADSVALPLAVAGISVVVRNSAANSMQVFGSGTDTINAVATATGVAQAATTSALYFCTASAPAGKWFRVLSA